ncbi:MAG: carbohydrate ABC transporter permease [Caldisphaera sp.]
MKSKKTFLFFMRDKQFLKMFILFFLLFLVILPLLITLNLSLKNNFQFYNERWTIKPPFHVENYSFAFFILWPYILNSLIYASTAAVGVTIISSWSGFVFSQGKFKGKNILFWIVISGLMLPGIMLLIPQFIVYKDLGLLNTRIVMILPYIVGGQIFGILLFRNFFDSLSDEFFEAARIDGANFFQLYYKIALPLSKSISATLIIITLLGVWGDVIWPTVSLTSNKLFPLATGILSFNQGYSSAWGVLFAGYIVSAIPLIIIFVFTSKYFVAGLTSGAFKL